MTGMPGANPGMQPPPRLLQSHVCMICACGTVLVCARVLVLAVLPVVLGFVVEGLSWLVGASESCVVNEK